MASMQSRLAAVEQSRTEFDKELDRVLKDHAELIQEHRALKQRYDDLLSSQNIFDSDFTGKTEKRTHSQNNEEPQSGFDGSSPVSSSSFPAHSSSGGLITPPDCLITPMEKAVGQDDRLFGVGAHEPPHMRTKKEEPQSRKVWCRYEAKGECRNGDRCGFLHRSRDGDLPMTPNVRKSPPQAFTVPEGFVALNKDNARLDPPNLRPAQEDWDYYLKLSEGQKLCNAHHLRDSCSKINCQYKHGSLNPKARRAFRYILKTQQCPRKGSCRDPDCIFGHMCQKQSCRVEACKMSADAHNVDTELATLVRAAHENVRTDEVRTAPGREWENGYRMFSWPKYGN
ncbi:hypothetical protein M011DRAFT_278249 [Sporormia fimetaria CBS 119925]|uniref:C3H1-type domain-containing protein n=1 Tax=Sporormia fimetaria CBS 119925 TaxID=1340428 RepID=A0A6A6VJW0_9PLEO|nr:hypothetical protein M011DRAFT_278249 [Sporormia fimetaria CBS 119925]